MTRVLHVSDCFVPRVGGIELHVRDLAAHQAGAGHDPAVLTRTAPTAQGAAATPEDPRVRREPSTLAPRRWSAALDRAIAEHRPDVVHVHVSVWSPLATWAARRCTRAGLPTLATVHSMWTDLGPLPAIGRGVLGLREWPLRWSAVSEAAAQPLRDMLGPGHDVAVLHNAVDVDFWRSARPIAPVEPTIVSVLRFARTKRPLPLVRVLADLDRRTGPAPWRAVLVGEGPLRERTERAVVRAGLAHRVRFTGRLERPELRDLLARSTAYVAPARLESFGLAPLEARSAGVPVVALSRTGVNDVVRHGREGLLVEDDAGLAAALHDLVSDPALAARLSAWNRAHAPALTWEHALARTEVLYAEARDVAAGARPAGPDLPLAQAG